MIRTCKEADFDEMVKIWYDASVIAHSFVPSSFWTSYKPAMKEKYLPFAENYVFEQEGKIRGFISLSGRNICAIFVAPEAQGKRIGKALLEYAKTLKGHLSLKVYRDNKKAIIFYEKNGFRANREEVDEYTGCVQILMDWGLSDLKFHDSNTGLTLRY